MTPSTTFSPSPEQHAIFSHLTTSTSNLCISAVAGSGKTTTLVELLKRIPRGDSILPPSILFLAFNKYNVETLSVRVPRGVQVSTFHSLGLRALKNSDLVPRNVRIDSRKIHRLIYNAVSHNNPDVEQIAKLVSLLKTIPPTRNRILWRDLAIQHNLSFEDLEKAGPIAIAIFKASYADLSCIDYDDMLYLPILYNASFDQQDYILVDEAQDTNDIQSEILARLCHSTSRFICVGDPYQAIYGFRGANSDAMTRIVSRFSCVSLPLSVSFRCPQAVVEEARRILQAPLDSF